MDAFLPSRCVECGLYRGCKTYKIPIDVSAGAKPPLDILFVAGAPDFQEDEAGQGLQSDAGEILKTVLRAWEGPWGCTFANKCKPVSGTKATPTQVKACEPFLTDDISLWEPKIIVCLGGDALKAVWPNGPSSVQKARVAPTKLGNVWVLATYAPGYFLHRHDDFETAYQDAQKEYTRVLEIADRIISGRMRDEAPDIRVVSDSEDMTMLRSQMSCNTHVTCDIETDTQDKIPTKRTIYLPDARLLCIAVGTSATEPVWVVPAHLVDEGLVRAFYGKTVVGHNVKYDGQGIAWWLDPSFWDRVDIEDTMLMHSSLDQGKIGNGLVDMASKYLGVPDWKGPVWEMVNHENQRQRKLKQPMHANLADIPFPVVAEMCGKDVYYTMRLREYLLREMPPRKVYSDLLIPATRALAQVELNGLGADRRYHAAIWQGIEGKMRQIETALRQQPAVQRVEAALSNGRVEPFKPMSPIHREHLLLETDIEVQTKTEKATVNINGVVVQRSKLDKGVLGLLADVHPIWAAIRAYSDYANLISKFIRPYGEHIAADGRIHCRYNVCKVEASGMEVGAEQSGGADSGRLAALDPSLMNLKKEPILQMMFRPLEGFTAAIHDYGQGEPRIAGWFSDCRSLINACMEGDLYRAMAALIWRIKQDSVTDQQRDLAKIGTLAGVLYGEGEENFAKRSKIPRHEAAEFFVTARRRFPELVEFQHLIIETARRGDEIESPFGRVYTFEYTGNPMLDAHTDRKAINAAIQGTLSDICVWKLIGGVKRYEKRDVRFVNIQHDSHWTEMKTERSQELIAEHKAFMEDLSDLPFGAPPIPFPVSVKWGPSFGELAKWAPCREAAVV